jgi:glyoxylase-like metal-dependent hydrolase (beta-lactamase superfamily II)
MNRFTTAILITTASLATFVAPAGAQPVAPDACKSLVPAAMGGPTPGDKNSIVLRWLSTSNYELAFRDQVILLDAYFEQGPRSRPTGIVPGEVKKTDAIFIGHPHFDHISDVGPVAQRTNARVIGAPITIDTA